MNDRLLTRPFVQLLLVQACFGYSFSSFSLLPKFLASTWSLDSSEIGSVMGSLGFSAVIGVPLVGYALDRTGAKPFLVTGIVLGALSAFGFVGLERADGWLYLLRVLQGVSFATYFVSGLTVAADLAPVSRMSQALGIFGVTNLIMNAIAPTATEIIAARYGWAPAFAGAGCFAVLAGLLLIGLPIPVRVQGVRGRSSVFSLLGTAEVMRPSLAIGLTAVTFSALFVLHQPYALENGIDNVSGFFVAYAIGAAIARLGFGDLADRKGHLRIARFAALPYALAPLVLLDVDVLHLVLAGGIMGLSHGFLYPALNALVVATTRASDRGTAMGVFLGAFNVGFALGPPLLGTLAESVGFAASFAVSAGFALVALLLLLAWRAERPGALRETSFGAGPLKPGFAASDATSGGADGATCARAGSAVAS